MKDEALSYLVERFFLEPHVRCEDVPKKMRYHAKGLQALGLTKADVETLLVRFCKRQGFGVRPEMIAEAIRASFVLTSRDSARYRAAALRNGRNGGGSSTPGTPFRFSLSFLKSGGHTRVVPVARDFLTQF